MLKFVIVGTASLAFVGTAVAADLPHPQPVVQNAPIGKYPVGKYPVGKTPVGKYPTAGCDQGLTRKPLSACVSGHCGRRRIYQSSQRRYRSSWICEGLKWQERIGNRLVSYLFWDQHPRSLRRLGNWKQQRRTTGGERGSSATTGHSAKPSVKPAVTTAAVAPSTPPSTADVKPIRRSSLALRSRDPTTWIFVPARQHRTVMRLCGSARRARSRSKLPACTQQAIRYPTCWGILCGCPLRLERATVTSMSNISQPAIASI